MDNGKIKKLLRELAEYAWGLHGDLECNDLLEMLSEAGVLEKKDMVVPCGDGCNCYEMHNKGETAECYRLAAEFRRENANG